MKIAAGVGDNKNIINAAESVDFEVITTESGDEIIELLFNGDVDAAIRGSLPVKDLMLKLRDKYPQIPRVTFMNLNGHKFILAPVGIDDVANLDQKLFLAEKGCEFLQSIGIKPKIGVLSAGREQDHGRNKEVDKLMEEGNLLTSMIAAKSFEIEHYYGIVEDAIKNATFVMASDGNSGNQIFRTLAFVCGVKSYGAVTLGMDEIYIDTSRSQTVDGYKRALNFANYLAEQKK